MYIDNVTKSNIKQRTKSKCTWTTYTKEQKLQNEQETSIFHKPIYALTNPVYAILPRKEHEKHTMYEEFFY